MKLFENGVGRPSNEIKKKRRLFVLGVSLGAVLLVGLGSFLTINATKQNMVTNPKRLKGASTTLDTKLADLDSDGKVTRKDLVKLKERLRNIYPYDMPGDVNNDGKINQLDEAIIANYLSHKNPDSGEYPEDVVPQKQILYTGDVYGDGIINIKDLVGIRQIKTKKFYAYGDVNKDYKVDSTDYKQLVEYLNKNNKINSKTIEGKNLIVSSYRHSGDKDNFGYNTKTGNYWGSTGLNIFASRKGTQGVAGITDLGNLSEYGKLTVYYQYAGDAKGMESNVAFYMNGVTSKSSKLKASTTKDGTTKWSSVRKAELYLTNETGNNNILFVYLDHGTNKSANTAIVKITKIVLE